MEVTCYWVEGRVYPTGTVTGICKLDEGMGYADLDIGNTEAVLATNSSLFRSNLTGRPAFRGASNGPRS